MDPSMMEQREHELLNLAFDGLLKIDGIKILADNVRDRIGALSFYHPEIHYNLMVKLLSDRYGIQMRGGCACAGTYGHYLLNVSYQDSHKITELINHGDLSMKPGWIRWSIHPTTRNDEILYIVDAVKEIVQNYKTWEQDYEYINRKNEYLHKTFQAQDSFNLQQLFEL